jgi:hypothetical protein
MSKGKKERVIHVDNLIIHAKNVKIIHDKEDHHHHQPKETHEHIAEESPRRNHWDSFMWGGLGREQQHEDEK